MKVCTKCGKSNDVMRKYCAGCGASLLRKEEDPIPEPVEAPEEVDDEPIAGAPSFSEKERHVLPSEIASKQVELEGDVPETSAVIEEIPLSEDVRIESEEEVEAPMSEPMSHEEGKQVVADILEKVRTAEARTRAEEDSEPSDTDLEPPPAEPLEIDEPVAYEEPTVEAEVEELSVEEPEIPEPEPIDFEEPPSQAEPVAAVVKADVPAEDDRVRSLESDINAYNLELEQLRTEFDTLRAHLDAEVERYGTVAEVKRIRVESIERELDLAKKEYRDANKEHKNVENRRKKELSNAEKRTREVEKRIKKAEESKDKRIRELEKERRKREEEAAKN